MFAESISLAPVLKARSSAPANVPCSDPRGLGGTAVVRTIFGLSPVFRLKVGDVLLDTRNRISELRSIRMYRAKAADIVRLEPSAFGLGLAPGRLNRALIVGAAQKLGICDWRTEILFSAPTLSAAARLVDSVNLHRADAPGILFELECDHDTIITADGVTTLIHGSSAQVAQDFWQ